jgi:predicted MFS family arabinose efflux permease
MAVSMETRGGRAAFGAILVFAMAIGAYTQFLLGMLAPYMIEDLGITRTQFGAVVTTSFLVGSVGAPVLGPLVDRLGGRRVLILMFLSGGIAWVGIGRAPDFSWILAFVVFGGIVRGISNPVGNKLIGTNAPREAQGVIMGISKSGAQVGQFAIGAIVPLIIVALGWRGVMQGSVLLAFAGITAALVIIPPDPPIDRRRRDRGERSAELDGLRSLMVWLSANALLVGFASGAINSYVPLFAIERLDMNITSAGAVVSAMALSGIAGRILWGRQADWFRDTQTPLMVISALGGVTLVLLTLSALLGWQSLLWAGAVGWTATGGSWITIGMLAIIREVPLGIAGRVSGFVLATFYIGLGLAPVTFGWIVDTTDSYAVAWGVGAVSYFAAAGVVWRWRRDVQRVRAERERTPEGPASQPPASDQE